MSKRQEFSVTTLNFYPNRNPRLRMLALWYFASQMLFGIIVGETVLGFEQSYADPLVAIGTACAMQILLEWVDARSSDRRLRFAGGAQNLLTFLAPALITGGACAILVYPNERLWPMAFAAGLSIASKVIFRAPVGDGRTQHIFNPSNIGITITLLLLPAVGAAPAYQFTENVTGVWHWIIPGLILVSGIVVHATFTGRLPLVLAWLGGFAAQALIRGAVFHIPWVVPFLPMTSAAFVLFTLFMIPDPATTPIKTSRQIAFGVAVALAYGMLLVMHVVYGLLIALAGVCAVRGISLYVSDRVARVHHGSRAAYQAAAAPSTVR